MLPRSLHLILALCLLTPGPALAQDLPSGLRLDASLLPEPGAEEGNAALLEQALQDEASPRLEALLGIQYLALHRSGDTARLCGRAVKSAVTMEPYYCLALAAYYAGDDQAGATWLDRARKMDPSRPETWLAEAWAASRKGDPGVVVGIMEEAQRRVGGDPTFWSWELLRLLDSMNDTEGAFQVAGRLMRLLPQEAEPFHRTALLFGKKGDLGEAVKLELAALEREPWHAEAARTLLLFLERDGRLEEARSWAGRFAELPQLPELRGFFLQERARYAEALEKTGFEAVSASHGLTLDERTLETTDPARVRAYLADLAAVSQQLGRHQRALELLEAARRTDPLDGRLRVAQAGALLALGRHEEARGFLGRSDQTDAEAYRIQAQAARLEGDPEGCVEASRRGLSMVPEHRDLQWNLALCLFDLRQDQDALEQLERILHGSPGDREAQLLRAGWYSRRDPALASALLWKLYLQEPWDFRVCLKGRQWAQKGRDALREASWAVACHKVLPPARAEERDALLERLKELDASSKVVNKAGLLASLCASRKGLCEGGTRQGAQVAQARSSLEAVARETFTVGGQRFAVETHGAGRFSKLEPRQRLQAWYLVRAAEAADALLYSMNHRQGLALVTLLEKIVAAKALAKPAQQKAAAAYLKLLWANHGPYDAFTGQKFVPEGLDGEALFTAMKRLEKAGERFEFLPGKDLLERYAQVEALIFDPSVEGRILTAGLPDPVKAGADNFYDPELGLADLPADHAKRAPNTRYELDPKTLSGRATPMNAAWRWGASISELCHFLRKAAELASDQQQQAALAAVADTLERGGAEGEQRFSAFANSPALAFSAGFLDASRDPLGLSGGLQVLVGIPGSDSEAFERFRTLMLGARAGKATRSLDGLGAHPLFGVFDGTLACASGAMPTAYGSSGCSTIFPELVYPAALFEDPTLAQRVLPEYGLLLRNWGRVAGRWSEYLRGVFARGLQVSKDLPPDRVALLVELGAQLSSLYYMADPRLVEAGAFPAEFHEQVLRAAHVLYYHDCVGSPFLALPLSGSPRARAKALLCHHFGEAATDPAVTFLDAAEGQTARLLNPWKLREAEGKLLEQVRAALAGDKAQLKMLARLAKAAGVGRGPGQPALRVLHVYPRLRPLLGADGQPLDAEILPPETFEQQRLRLARLRGSLVND